MLIRIQYNNDKYDYVPGQILDEMLSLSNIKQFYRHSEQRWVTVGVDRIRGTGGRYVGPERREAPLAVSA
jgi:hypothetical protein